MDAIPSFDLLILTYEHFVSVAEKILKSESPQNFPDLCFRNDNLEVNYPDCSDLVYIVVAFSFYSRLCNEISKYHLYFV